ncbi:hypothetical protein [Candidatus Uabimicrobium amorphum]|uniref:Uncharacterized protein n=1 Tax=Uabimicrobium amorphum TaxID=2596890 RepID=A0A5S9IJU0_UABAM|nr:hypothetical protein [Candidatus Uabimicrobium amorphum]BBM83189.1 hypothetical protein UABAM_01540 [Candidatus Uabimicrobium amorphum]
MNKVYYIVFMLLFAVAIYAQESLHAAEVRHFDIEKYLSKAGNIRMSDKGGVSSMEKKAEEHLFTNIREHLSAKKLLPQLHSMEVVKSDIVVVATPQANREIAYFLRKMEVLRSFSVQIQLVRAIPLDKVQLKEKEKWQFPNVHIVVDAVKTEEAQQQITYFKKHATVMASPTIAIADNFINKLEMASKENLNYVSGYRYVQIVNQPQKVTIPELKKLERKFNLHILPFPKKDQNHHLHLRIDVADYVKPIKQIKTKDGPIHRPQIYNSSQMIALLFKTPSTVRVIAGPNQKGEVNILYVNIDLRKNKPTGLLSGRVIAKVERKVTWNEEQVDLPQMATQYVLETGKSSYLREKQNVSLYRKSDNQKVSDGKIVEVRSQVCIAEFSTDVTIPLSEVYFSVHGEKK